MLPASNYITGKKDRICEHRANHTGKVTKKVRKDECHLYKYKNNLIPSKYLKRPLSISFRSRLITSYLLISIQYQVSWFCYNCTMLRKKNTTCLPTNCNRIQQFVGIITIVKKQKKGYPRWDESTVTCYIDCYATLDTWLS